MSEGGGSYSDVYRRSIEEPETFWAEQAQAIEWKRPFDSVLDYSRPPFARWFCGGTTNLCHNALDRHLGTRAEQAAIVYVSTETGVEAVYSYRDLYDQVNTTAAMLQELGVGRGDRVLIYMPMVPEAVFAMLACARIGAIHSVVFGGFASVSLAARIDDAQPKVVLSADAGSRSGKVVPYTGLLAEALRLADHAPSQVLWLNRGLDPTAKPPGAFVDWATLAQRHAGAVVPCAWLESSEPSYILYTSGTTGIPKGVQRDTGGYAVALAASMKYIFDGHPGDVFFATSDIGWVVGHSYVVYAPLLAGLTTVLYEGTPIRPDGGIWWRLVEKYRITGMFSAPTAIRVLKKQDPTHLRASDLSSLRAIYLAGEPLDEPTARWIGAALDKPVLDNYWQTETGWPILAPQRGIDSTMELRWGSPGKPVYGYRVCLIDEASFAPVPAGEKGLVAIEGPLPPGGMTTVWRDDARFVATYWTEHNGRWLYSSFDWGICDEQGYWYILGRTDDVINVAGHRLGTREIEESISAHPNISECAVVGMQDALKGQVAMAFAIVRDTGAVNTLAERLQLEGEVMATVDQRLGAIARPARVFFVTALPKTRSGKMLRRALQAVCEGRDPGDLTTIEDPGALEHIRRAVTGQDAG